MKSEKILFFGKLPPPYTGENVVSHSILKLLEADFDITILNTSGSIEKKEGLFKKINYFTNQILYVFRSFVRLNNVLKKEKKFKFLYFSGSSSLFGNLSDYILVHICRKHVEKIICHLHRGNFKDNFTKFRFFNAGKYLSNNIDKFIFLSKSLSNDVRDHIPEAKREVLSNPIDKYILLTEAEFKNKLELLKSKNRFIITYLSNFILSKGYMEIVEALKLLPAEIKDKLLVRFIGEWIDSDIEKNTFFQSIHSKELSSSIEYIGPLKVREKIKNLLIESDIFCLPSYYALEAQPVSIIEAMNAGNAIISTVHASIPEYVDNYKFGLLIEKRNTAALAKAIEYLCDSETLSTFSVNARKKFLENFNELIIAKKLRTIFN